MFYIFNGGAPATPRAISRSGRCESSGAPSRRKKQPPRTPSWGLSPPHGVGAVPRVRGDGPSCKIRRPLLRRGKSVRDNAQNSAEI